MAVSQVEKHYREKRNTFLKQAYGFLKDHGWAEDAVQEAYARAFKYEFRGPEIRDFDGWMYVIFLNTLKWYKKKLRENGVVMEVIPQKFPVAVFNFKKVKERDLLEYINRYVKKPERRHALKLWAIKGYTALEVEEMCGVGVYAIYNEWKKVKGKLQEE